MSWKGHKFVEADLPKNHRLTDVQAFLDAQTERYRIVCKCPKTGAEYIAEEVQERALRTLSPNVRVIATQMLVQLTAAERLEVLAAFDKQGELKIPFDRV